MVRLGKKLVIVIGIIIVAITGIIIFCHFFLKDNTIRLEDNILIDNNIINIKVEKQKDDSSIIITNASSIKEIRIGDSVVSNENYSNEIVINDIKNVPDEVSITIVDSSDNETTKIIGSKKVDDDSVKKVEVNSFYIEENNPSYINNNIVTLHSDVLNATEMCFSNTTSCAGGTGWIKYNEIYNNYILGITSGKATVYAWYRNSKKEVSKYQYDQVIVGSETNENYNSVIDLSTTVYKNDKIIEDINKLVSKYPQYSRAEKIGTSVFGRDIYAIIVGNLNLPAASTKKILIMGNMHAREVQSAQIIMKQAEYYLENMNNYYKGKKLNELFEDAAIYFIPTTNPDGNEIVFEGIRMQNGSPACQNIWNCWGSGTVIDKNKYTQNYRFTWADKVEKAVSKKLQYYYSPGADMDDGFMNATYKSYDKEDKEFWNKFMYSNDYQYRDRDIIIWKANANGVDLHYNFYEDGVNYDFTKTCVYKNNTESRYKCGYNLYNTYFENGSIKGTFSTEGYVGETGFSEPETKAIYDFIENNKIYEYAITYHGRGPAIMWNYTSKWENTKSLLARKKQFNNLSYAISKVSHIARTTNTNGPLGFSGWFQQKYHGLAINFEIGWSNWDKNNIGESFKQNKNGNYQANKSLPFDTCPLDASQLPYIWITQKDVPIELVYQIQDGKGLERVYTN